MIDDKAAEYIRMAAESEFVAIAARHGGGYNSNHEAHSVLREEMEEADEAMMKLKADFDKAWKAVRENSLMKSEVENVMYSAMKAMGELTQVAAVCKRWLMGVKDERA